MNKTLEVRLKSAKSEFVNAKAEIARLAGKLPLEVQRDFRAVIAFEADIEPWIGMIHARSVARQMLTGLEFLADSADLVPFGASRIDFRHARLLGVQAYLATNWALADSLTRMVGRVLCIKNSCNDPKQRPQLVSHFVGDKTKSISAAMLFASVKQTFGWPIGLSYALRNHFVHDGGQLAGADFFEGPNSRAAFEISGDGWAHIETTARGYGVEPAHHRAGAGWPATPRGDLRVMLDSCEREVDDALGVLVGSASRSFVSHIGYMLGAD